MTVSEEEQQQQQNQELTVLDHVIDKLKSDNNNKINSYNLLSGFVAYLQEVEGVENPNTLGTLSQLPEFTNRYSLSLTMLSECIVNISRRNIEQINRTNSPSVNWIK